MFVCGARDSAPFAPGPSQDPCSPRLSLPDSRPVRVFSHVAARSQSARGVRSHGNSCVQAPQVSRLLQTWLLLLFRYPILPRKHTHTHTHIHTRSSAPANTHIHTCSSAPANTYIHTRSSAPAPSAGTMDDSKEEYEAAFRSLLRKLTLSSRESTPPPGSP